MSRLRGPGPLSAAARRRGLCIASSLAWMIAIEVIAAALPPDVDLPAAEWQAIQRVISAQRTALKTEDGTRAFAFASEGLRREFGTPENFMRMVHAGYQPLIDARYVEFLDGAVIDGVPVQPLRLVLPDNTVLVALYTMKKEDDGRWHIAGCAIAPSTIKAV